MNLIDRYIHAVGRQLPRKDREDIQIEIRSLLEDTLDNYAAKQGRDIDDEMVVAVLEEFGSPQAIAQSYAPQKAYLIGPEMFPAFKVGVLIYAGVVTLFYLLSLVFSVGTSQNVLSEFIQAVFQVAPDYLSALVRVLGTMVIIFAVLERILPEKEPEPEQWDPLELPEIDDYSEVNRLGLVLETAVTIALLLLLNFFPEKIGITIIHDSQVTFVPLLGPSYTNFLLAINIWWLLSIVLNIIVLNRGLWTRATRWAEVGINMLGVFVLYRIFVDGNFFSFNPTWITEISSNAAELVESLTPFFSLFTKGIIGFILFITIIEIIQQLYKLLFKYPGQLGQEANVGKLVQ